MSQLLNTQLDKETLATCVSMIESGVNPEALAVCVSSLPIELVFIDVSPRPLYKSSDEKMQACRLREGNDVQRLLHPGRLLNDLEPEALPTLLLGT